MRTRLSRLVLAVLLALGCRTFADSSVEIRGAAGPGTWSAGATAGLDLDTDWSMTATNDYTSVSGTSAPSLTDLATLSFTDLYTQAWQFKTGLDFSNDSINQILYAGPDLGFTYTRDRPDADPAQQASKDGSGADAGVTDSAAASASASASAVADDSALWALTFAAPINGYAVNLGVNSSSGITKATKKAAGIPYTVTDDERDLDITQFYPNLALEVPCFSGTLVPSLLYGHDFYDQNPATVAYVINRRFELGNGSYRVSNLVAALYTDTITASLVWKLPYSLSLTGSFGESQMIAPYVWVSTAEAELGLAFNKTYSAKAGWSDTVEFGQAQPEALAGVDASF